jgi:hypothetical protein
MDMGACMPVTVIRLARSRNAAGEVVVRLGARLLDDTPVLAGLFLGAPMVAAEYEASTTQFAWMQGITRARWLGVKAGWLLAVAAAWGGVLAALTTWWASPTSAEHGSEFYPGRFDVLYLVPVAYAVFAMALGICAGALIRRTVPAIAVTLGGFLAARAAVAVWLRPHYMSAVTVTRNLPAQIQPTGSSWLLSQGVRNPAGQLISGPSGTQGPAAEAFGVPVSSLPKACAGLANPTGGLTSSCRAALTGFRSFVTYQPLLGVPGYRDRCLRRPRGPPADPDRRRADPPGRLTTGPAGPVPVDGAAQPLDTGPGAVPRLGAEGEAERYRPVRTSGRG